MMDKRELINKISLQVGIKLRLIKQEVIPKHIERQVKYLCEDIVPLLLSLMRLHLLWIINRRQLCKKLSIT